MRMDRNGGCATGGCLTRAESCAGPASILVRRARGAPSRLPELQIIEDGGPLIIACPEQMECPAFQPLPTNRGHPTLLFRLLPFDEEDANPTSCLLGESKFRSHISWSSMSQSRWIRTLRVPPSFGVERRPNGHQPMHIP